MSHAPRGSPAERPSRHGARVNAAVCVFDHGLVYGVTAGDPVARPRSRDRDRNAVEATGRVALLDVRVDTCTTAQNLTGHLLLHQRAVSRRDRYRGAPLVSRAIAFALRRRVSPEIWHSGGCCPALVTRRAATPAFAHMCRRVGWRRRGRRGCREGHEESEAGPIGIRARHSGVPPYVTPGLVRCLGVSDDVVSLSRPWSPAPLHLPPVNTLPGAHSCIESVSEGTHLHRCTHPDVHGERRLPHRPVLER